MSSAPIAPSPSKFTQFVSSVWKAATGAFLSRPYGTKTLKDSLRRSSLELTQVEYKNRFTPKVCVVDGKKFLGPFYNTLNNPKFLGDCVNKEYIYASQGGAGNAIAARGHHEPLPPNVAATVEFFVSADDEGVEEYGPTRGLFTGYQIRREEEGEVPVIVTRYNDHGGNERLVDENSNAIPPVPKKPS